MNSALVGFRVDGVTKLQRLHGCRSGEAVLKALHLYLARVSDAQIKAYASQVSFIRPEHGLFLTEDQRGQLRHLESMLPQQDGLARCQAWSDLFAIFPGLDAWHWSLPFLPAAQLDLCADIHWGYLLDLDLGELQIFDNRNARFTWRAIGIAEPAFCTLSLKHARSMTLQDICTLQNLLQLHVCADGKDPVLPMLDAESESFKGPGNWQAKIKLRGGKVKLLLKRDGLEANICRVGAVSLDDPGCGDFLRQALAPAALALASAIYGAGASLAQVSLVTGHMHLLPDAPSKSGMPLLDLALRSNNGLKLKLGPGFFDELRILLLDNGLTVQGWRFLIKQSDAALRTLLQFFPPSLSVLPGFSSLVNLLASALQGEGLCAGRSLIALRGVERILDRTRGRPGAVREENARIFLRAIMRAHLTDEEEANLDHEAQDVSDFVYSHQAVLKGATWRSLRRRSSLWHRALLIQVDPAKDVRWPALLPRHELGSFVAVELDSGALLAEEGLEQRHCIGSYVNACSSGASRVFSLRQNGRRLATIELQRSHDGDWRMVQIRGKANTPIRDLQALEAAESLVNAYAQKVRFHEGLKTDNLHPALRPGAYVTPDYLVHRQDHWTG